MLEQLLGRLPPEPALRQLETYAGWLADEGMPAGGIGPGEAERIWERHILDAAAFSLAWTAPPATCVDLGSGVGLPGIVLAVLWPDTTMRLVDRSQRRVRLMRRAVRILGLDNADVVQEDVVDTRPGQAAVVMRATLPPPAAVELFSGLLAPAGQAVLGISRTREPAMAEFDQISRPEGFELRLHSAKVLDPPSWMLIMSRS